MMAHTEPESVPGVALRSPLSEQAAAHLRAEIFQGRYRAGDFIRIDRVASSLGMSTTPVREALAMLQSQGFVAIKPHYGFIVLPVAAEDINDVFVIRAFLAGELTARACPRLDAPTLQSLRDLHQSFIETSKKRRRYEDLERLNLAFHQTIYQAAGSGRLLQFQDLALLYAPSGVYPRLAGWIEGSIAQHEAVLEALTRRRQAAARRAMEDHIRSSGKLVCAWIGGLDKSPPGVS
jgi:DNA-binding GntR family transcriptional regulator